MEECTMKRVVEVLTKCGKTISTMESCTGGAVASAITDVEGASEVLKFSAVTYSNEYKIAMGVDANVIEEYSVYSMETAREMSKNISCFAKSDYGIGITGKLNRVDVHNLAGSDNVVFVSIYRAQDDAYHDFELEVGKASRPQNKELVVERIVSELLGMIE